MLAGNAGSCRSEPLLPLPPIPAMPISRPPLTRSAASNTVRATLTALAIGLSCAMTMAQIAPPRLLVDLNRTSNRFQRSSFPIARSSLVDASWRRQRFAPLGGRTFFQATTPSTGAELFACGEALGSGALVADINPGTSGSNPENFLVASNRLFFAADDGANGFQIWTTEVGGGLPLRRLTSLPGTGASGSIGPIIEFGGNILFTAQDPSSGQFMVHSVEPATATVTQFTAPLLRHWVNPVLVGNLVLFEGTGFAGTEPWWVDGLNAAVLRDGPGDGGCRDPLVAGGTAWFAHDDGNGWAIWSWPGVGLPQRVAPLNATDGWNDPVALGSRIVFGAEPPGAASRPFVFDRANPGAGILALPVETNNLAQPAITRPVRFQGRVYYWGYSATQAVQGHHVFCTDGVTASSIAGSRIGATSPFIASAWEDPEVLDVGPRPSIVFRFTALRSEAYAFDGASNLRLRIHGANQSDSARAMTRIGNSVVFGAQDGRFGNELWRSDGTVEGTSLHTNLIAESRTNSSTPTAAAMLGRELAFSADDGVNGRELWVTDGREVMPFGSGGASNNSGTRKLDEVQPGPASSNPQGTGGLEAAATLLVLASQTALEIFVEYSRAPGGSYTMREIRSNSTTTPADFLGGSTFGNDYFFVAREPGGSQQVHQLSTGPGGSVTPLVSPPQPQYSAMRDVLRFLDSLYFIGGSQPGGVSSVLRIQDTPTGPLASEIVIPGNYTDYTSLAGNRASGSLMIEATSTARRRVMLAVDAVSGAASVLKTSRGEFFNAFASPFPAGDKTLFMADDPRTGNDVLHETDGTLAGTRIVDPTPLFAIERFRNPATQDEDARAVELGDGSASVFFPATSSGVEVWTADAQGVARVGSQTFIQVWQAIALGADRVAAVAETNSDGTELFVIDRSGATMVSDVLAPGSASGAIRDGVLWATEGRLVFTGSSPRTVGNELFYVDVGALAQPFGASSTDPALPPDPRLRATDPRIGQRLDLNIVHAPPSANTAYFSLAIPGATPQRFRGRTIYIDLGAAITASASISAGSSTLPIPIPNDPTLLDLTLDAQAMFTPVSGFPVGVTNGMTLRVGR